MHAVQYRPYLEQWLRDDLGRGGDLTTDAVISAEATAEARIVARAGGVIAGLDMAIDCFRILDADVKVTQQGVDGDVVADGATLAVIAGNARAILAAERTALNILGRLSGIASMTAAVVRAVAHTDVAIADTRKTTPGLGRFEKYAVRCGGGANHRFGLDDAVMIKDNHIAVAGSISEAVRAARAHVGHTVKIEVEVDTLDQLATLLEDPVDIVLLDNMDLDTLRRAVAMVDGMMITEASGGITLETAGEIATTGVDVLSLGWLTHSVGTLDVALDISL